MDLISQLKQEHIEILRLIEGKSLRELKEILIIHLKLEDKLLYPVLENCINKKSREIGQQFSKEMLTISKTAMKFFKEYEKKDIEKLSKDIKFKKEFSKISNAIKTRIKIEEEILFPEFKNSCVNK
jgi:hypothetical protein